MVRRFRKTDLDAAAEIWLDTNIRAHSFIPAQYWRDNFEAVKGMLAQAEVYVFENQGGIKGFIGLDGGYVAGIFVREAAQSGGIGRRLMDFVKEGRKQLGLSVYQKNGRAVRFYQREGFHIQREQMDKSTGEAEYYMEWRQGEF